VDNCGSIEDLNGNVVAALAHQLPWKEHFTEILDSIRDDEVIIEEEDDVNEELPATST
jgi:hypothetical protein